MIPRYVVFAPEAEADLLWIYDTIAAAADPQTAFSYILRIAATRQPVQILRK